MNKHELKIWPQYFKAVWDGTKTFEIRRNDRHFQIGDMLVLREFDPDANEYTGSAICKKVSYILDDSAFVKEGYVVMGIAEWTSINLPEGGTPQIKPLNNEDMKASQAFINRAMRED